MSKSRYMAVQAERAFWWLDSLLFYVTAALCLVILLSFAFGILHKAPWPIVRDIVNTERIWLLLCFPGLIYLCFAVARGCLTRCQKIEPVLPLVARTENSLPASDSLVRASVEPRQESVVLLRAATPTQERQEEHLLRAIGRPH